jgi:RHS repeat-associated protein
MPDQNPLSRARERGEGETRYTSGATPTDFRYTGQRFESLLGLHDYGARWYDSLLGRWVQPDTIVPLESQGVQAWDRYAYANNNPVRYNDPTGHCLILCTALIGGAVGAIVGAVGYTAYTAISGTEFNTSHMLLAAGGGAAAGALIGTGVGIAAGMSSAAATTAAVTGGGAATTATTTVLNATGGDPSDEIKAAAQAVQSVGSAVNSFPSTITKAIQTYYPPNMGFSGAPKVTTLHPGELVSRYGSTYGSFLSPAGTPTWARSLPPGVEKMALNTYEVVKPIPNVLSGKAAEWWGQIGGGIQYYVGSQHGQNIQTLLNSGHLKPYLD